MHRFFCSCIRFVGSLLLVIIGVVGLLTPWSASIRTALVDFIQHHAVVISLFSIAFLVVGSALIVNIFLHSRRTYYCLPSSDNTVFVDENLIRQHLSHYWQQQFPKCDIVYEVALKDNKLSISVDFPSMPLSEQRLFLEKVKNELRILLTTHLGYQENFSLTASFAVTS